MKIRDLDEDAFLKILLPGLPSGRNLIVGPGDDCAVVIAPGASELLLLKTDCIVEGVHYRPEEDPVRVGRKAICRALSDIAAMGGEPRHALVNIFSPPDVPVAYWKSFYEGLSSAAEQYAVGVVGGETSRAPTAAVSVSLIGHVERHRLLLRSTGKPGDRLIVTGSLGGSLSGKHLDFEPRIAEGRWLGAHGHATSMMDLSDGLAADLPRLAAASGCGFTIDSDSIPRTRGRTVHQALTDGEDYELLFTSPPRFVERLLRGWKTAFPKVRLTEIGHLCEPGASTTAMPRGFDHFFSGLPDQ
jgi:thiamine-monophosphate kinase